MKYQKRSWKISTFFASSDEGQTLLNFHLMGITFITNYKDMTRAQREFFIFAYEEYKKQFDIDKENTDKYGKIKKMIRSKKSGRS